MVNGSCEDHKFSQRAKDSLFKTQIKEDIWDFELTRTLRR